jgi:hypothetical protein
MENIHVQVLPLKFKITVPDFKLYNTTLCKKINLCYLNFELQHSYREGYRASLLNTKVVSVSYQYCKTGAVSNQLTDIEREGLYKYIICWVRERIC